jgi:hypothetical protein
VKDGSIHVPSLANGDTDHAPSAKRGDYISMIVRS